MSLRAFMTSNNSSASAMVVQRYCCTSILLLSVGSFPYLGHGYRKMTRRPKNSKRSCSQCCGITQLATSRRARHSGLEREHSFKFPYPYLQQGISPTSVSTKPSAKQLSMNAQCGLGEAVCSQQ